MLMLAILSFVSFLNFFLCYLLILRNRELIDIKTQLGKYKKKVEATDKATAKAREIFKAIIGKHIVNPNQSKYNPSKSNYNN